jgi:multicomponent Na+:H+ antiporter subunit D
MLPLMRRTRTLSVDWDWLWRRPGAWLGRGLVRVTEGTESGVVAGLRGVSGRVSTRVIGLFGPGGRWHRPLPIGDTALWIAVLLTAFVVINLL